MFLPKCYLLLVLLLTILFDPSAGRRTSGGHSYPRSGGLSGGGHHSGGLSGGGHGYPSSSGGHGYPSSGGLSGSGRGNPSSGTHGYPAAGGSHSYPSQSGYPSSGGSQGYPSSGGNRGYPSSGGNHGYPSSGGSHGYPSSGGLSGNSHGYPSSNKGHTTNIYNNYHYSPPQQITYASPRGGPAQSFPVYRGQPPTYVYQYKNSDSKYGTLLAGLALMNLGTLGVAAYAATRNNNPQYSSSSHTYRPLPGEVCKFGVKKDNGDYEETRIDCQIISGFILQEQASHQPAANNATITTTTTVTNVTMVNMTNGVPDQPATMTPPTVLYAMLPNGTLVPVNNTGTPVNTTTDVASAPSNGSMTSSVTVTTTTTNTTLVNALDVKGKPVEVTPGMQCFVIRNSPTSNMRKTVPCGVLQTYADKSIHRNAAAHHAPMFTVLAAAIAYCLA